MLHGTLTDYQPESILPAEVKAHAVEKVLADSVISLLIWNQGYAGLGAEADFFYQGGGFFTSRGRNGRANAGRAGLVFGRTRSLW